MRKNEIKLMLAAVIMALFAGMGISCYSSLKKQAEGELGFVYRSPSVTREQMETWWQNAGEDERKYIKDMTLWKSPEEVNAVHTSLGRSAKAQLIRAAGNMNLIMPGKLCRGSLVSDGDNAGCVISRKLAQELNLDETGGSIQVSGKQYLVRGILDSRDAVCIIQGESGTLYNRVQVQFRNMPASGAERMLSGLLPGNADVKSEGDLFRGLGGLFLMAPLWVLFVMSAVRLHRFYRDSGWKNWVKEVCSICFPVAVIGGIGILVLISFHFSDDYIPGAWSDFSFFSRLALEKAEDVRVLMTQALDYRDRDMLVWTAGCMLAGSACSVIILKFPRCNSTGRRNCLNRFRRPPAGFCNNKLNHHP